MRLYLTLFALVLFKFTNGQLPRVPLHFEGNNLTYSFINFSGGNSTVFANPHQTGINTSPTVCRMVKTIGQPWGGSVINLDTALDLTFKRTMKMKIWSPRSNIEFRFKIENDTNPNLFFEIVDTIQIAQQWHEMTFDLTGINTAHYYNRIVIIFDFGQMGDGSFNSTYYYDDIVLEHPLVPAQLKTALIHRVDMTNEIKLRNFDPTTNFLVMAGADFWPNCGPVLQDNDGDSIYQITDTMWVGEAVRFKYFIFNKPAATPTPTEICRFPNGVFESDGFATNCADTLGGDRYFIAPYNLPVVTLPVSCFGECLGCTPLDVSDTNEVTFTVNMNNYSKPFGRVYLSGDFNSWSPDFQPMEHIGNGFYQTTVALPPSLDSNIIFKFQVDRWNDSEQFDSTASCTQMLFGTTIVNRHAIITSDTVLPAFCWDSCTACNGTPGEPFEVTFQLDIRRYTKPFTTIFWSSELNGWCADCDPLTDEDGDDIFTVTKRFYVDSVSYKFQLDRWAVEEYLLPGSACTDYQDIDFVNRIVRATGDTTLPVVCWQSCNNCSTRPDSVFVEFSVDMKNVMLNYTTVNLNGDFNSWCGDCLPIFDHDKNGVFDTVLKLPLGRYEHLFTLDSYTHIESFGSGDDCVTESPTNVNRVAIVNRGKTLPTYCWGSCIECFGYPSEAELLSAETSVELVPNPVSDNVNLEGQVEDLTNLRIFDITGRLVYDFGFESGVSTTQFNLSQLPSGLYTVEMSYVNGTTTAQKLIKL